MDWERFSDSPELVVPVYIFVILPLLLYVYHDVLDKRWRHVGKLFFFLCCYSVLYVISGSILILYIAVQGVGMDFKECGACAVTIMLGAYEATKLFRLARILNSHHDLVKVLDRVDKTLAELAGVKPIGFPYKLLNAETRKQFLNPSNGNTRILEEEQDRHLMLSSTLFDDDFPGDAGARIRWVPWRPPTRRVAVIAEDAETAAARMALWIRLVLRRPQSEPWRLATSSSPLVTGHIYRTSLGNSLRRLVLHGIGAEARPPTHFSGNPVELLLNNEDLGEIGVGFFWLATLMSAEEMSQALAEMPPRWVRGITQNGKSLMWETSIGFILCNFPKQDLAAMERLLKLPVLQWQDHIKEDDVWKDVAEVCADAVASLCPRMPGETDDGEEFASREQIFNVVRDAVLALRDATTEEFGYQGDIIGLTLLELIRASCRSGYMAEQILGPEFYGYVEHAGEKTGRLCKADICTGLASVLIQLGQADGEKIRRRLDTWKRKWGLTSEVRDVVHALREHARQLGSRHMSFDEHARSAFWLLGDLEEKCAHPHYAFAALVRVGGQLAPCVVNMCEEYLSKRPRVCIQPTSGSPANFRIAWVKWKLRQAVELSRNSLHIVTDASVSMGFRRVSAADNSIP